VKRVIAIAVGDPAGIGPEIVAGTIESATVAGRPVLFGHRPTVEAAFERLDARVEVTVSDEPAPPPPGGVTLVPAGPDCPPICEPGAAAAQAQVESLELALRAVLDGPCESLVTAPMNKALAATVEPSFVGHTEFLARRAGLDSNSVTMVFVREGLAVGLVATHVPLAEVPSTITKQRYRRTLRHLTQVLEILAPGHAPRIAVAALNPHGGEEGRFGREERDVIEPICRTLAAHNGIELHGPIPADTVYRDAFAGRYDGVVAAYHDQALIPLKLGGPGLSTNVTMGLPFVRTSPDHGVAYDLARRGEADPRGMAKALDIASRLCSDPDVEL
jgi:4-hydroxythreonine-4-phosphate dehydrogenase